MTRACPSSVLYFENTPEGIQWLVKIIRKPRGVGADIKNACCATMGVMLRLELQLGAEEMSKQEYADK